MADMQTALRKRIVDAAPGDGMIAARVYWAEAPQNTLRPYIILSVISDPRADHLKGYNGSRRTRVQADIYADRYAQAKAVADDLIASVAPADTIDGVRFGWTKAEGPRDLGETTASGFSHRASVDLLVRHRSS